MLKQSSYTTFLSNYIFTPQPTIQIDTFGRSIVTPHTYIHLVLKQRPSLRTPIHTPCTIKFRPITHLLRIYYRGAALLSLSLLGFFFSPQLLSNSDGTWGPSPRARRARALNLSSSSSRPGGARQLRRQVPEFAFFGRFFVIAVSRSHLFFSSLPEVLGACVYTPRRVIWRDEKCSSAQ